MSVFLIYSLMFRFIKQSVKYLPINSKNTQKDSACNNLKYEEAGSVILLLPLFAKMYFSWCHHLLSQWIGFTLNHHMTAVMMFAALTLWSRPCRSQCKPFPSWGAEAPGCHHGEESSMCGNPCYWTGCSWAQFSSSLPPPCALEKESRRMVMKRGKQ